LRRKQKKSKYLSMIAGTFFLLYITVMFFSTYMVKEDYEKDYDEYLIRLCSDMKDTLEADNATVMEMMVPGDDRVELAHFHQYISLRNQGLNQYQKLSVGIYDEGGKLIAKTGNLFGDYWHMHQVDHYFTKDDMEKIIGFYKEAPVVDKWLTGSEHMMIQSYYIGNPEELIGVQFRDFETGDILWNWKKDNSITDFISESENTATGYVFLPYLYYGRDAWEEWKQDAWLQGFPEVEDKERLEEREIHYNGIIHHIEETAVNAGTLKGVYGLFVWENLASAHMDSDEDQLSQKYSIEIRQRIHPWMAAMDYMKYVYIGSFLLVFFCMFLVLYAMRKIRLQQECLEQDRRDFINAAAHELKTPLGIIRGFAENVKENTVEEKRDYYLEQIIAQTESMDELVKEMIGLSKIDSMNQALGQEKICVKDLLEEQIEKLTPLLENTRISLEKQIADSFMITGDSHLLGKAFWNLLENAVLHNIPNGWIRITLTDSFCMIENSGKVIGEEDLKHIKDMFYTGDESRHDSSNHRGLGLYLADRIFMMHGLHLEIANREDGVMVTVSHRLMP